MKYNFYTVHDFLMDERFQQWVKNPTEELNAWWNRWISTHPERKNTLQEARQVLLLMDFEATPLPGADREKMYTQILGAISQDIEKAAEGRSIDFLPQHSLTRRWNSWHQLVAVLAGLLVLGAVYAFFFRQHASIEHITHYGETKKIILPDSSTVVLNANSRLRYASNWQHQADRAVWLDGEAFFSVTKKKRKATAKTGVRLAKFVVHTKDVRIQVIGTKFNVVKRHEKTQVILTCGRIELDVLKASGTERIVMKPGDLVEFKSENKQVLKQTVKPQLYSSWTNHKWILENTSLADVASRIEETFGCEVLIPDQELAQEKMTGVVPTAHLNDALAVLEVTYGVQILQKENNQLLITK